MYASAVRTTRASNVARLLTQQGRVVALEENTVVFQAVLRAAQTGFPRAIVVAAKTELETAVSRGNTLSPRSAELLSMLKKTERSFKTPRLLQ